MNITYSVHKNSNAVFMKYDHAGNVRRHKAQPIHTQGGFRAALCD